MMRLLPLLVVLPFFCLLASAPARSADLELSVDPEVLQETRQILNRLPVMEYEGVRYVDLYTSPEESEKAAAHFLALQPASGDALVTIAVDREDPARMFAAQMLYAMGDGLTWPQIEVLLRVLPIAYVESLSHYPKGTAAYIRTGYRDVWGFKGAEVRTTSYKFLDGKPYGEPSKYRGSPSSSGGIRVDELGYGAHTAQAVTEYELSYRGKSIKGRFESPVVTFEIIQALTPEIRAAPRNAELDRLVRRICRFVEVKESDSNSNSSNPRFEDPWKPSRTMYRNNSPDIYAIHMPLFVVSEVLPVDLSFDVELQVIETGEIFEGDSIVFSKGRPGDGPSHISLTPRDSLRFAKLKEGFISIKAVLKPSRAMALSDSRITQYYTGTLTSPALRAKTYWFLQASAEPWLVELQAKAEIAKRILAADLQPSQRYDRLTSTNPYMRSYAAYDVSRQEDALRESYLPFLIKLLQDDRTHLPTQPAVQARNALVAIGEPAVDPLIAALTHEAAKIRMRAATALGRIAVPRVVDPLIAALEDSERDVRLAAVNALGLLKDPRSVAPLQATLTDVAGVVRRGAAQALTTIEIHYTVVEFPDPGLEKSIRAAIDKPVGEIQIGDLVGVGFENLSASRAKIEDLTGLEYCTDLSTLWLGDNAISDLRPLSRLGKVKRLVLNRNRILDLTPLSLLSTLTTLELTSNPVADVAPLSTLTGLVTLYLNDTLLSDVAPLSTMSSLKVLYLNGNRISDIAGLSNLANLARLELRRNALADLSPLSHLEKLTTLDVSNNQTSDLSALANLENLKYLKARDNNITNLKPLGNLRKLNSLDLRGNPIIDIRALSKLDKLENLDLSNTSLRDVSVLSTMTNLRRLSVTDLGWPEGSRVGFEDSFTVDFSVLSPLTKLTTFRASGNRIADMAFVSNFEHLQRLGLARNEIEDIGVIAKMKELQSIDFEANRISDIGVLSNLVHLKHMRLDRNRIVDIGPLANQSEPRAGASITLSENPLNCESIQVHIPALKERGVTVYTDAVCVSSITPNFAPNSGPVNVEIQIESLEGRPHIVLVREQEPPLTAISVKILAPDRVACTFDLTGATPGVLDIVVSVGAHGRKRGTLIGGFTVTDATSGIGITPGN